MASNRSLLVLGLCALVVCALIAETPLVEARELRGAQLDRTVVNCRSFGTDNMGRRVCTACHDNHVLIPGGIECRRRSTTVWNGK